MFYRNNSVLTISYAQHTIGLSWISSDSNQGKEYLIKKNNPILFGLLL